MTRHIVYRRNLANDLVPDQVDDNFQSLDTDLATAETKVTTLQTGLATVQVDLTALKTIVGGVGLPDITGQYGALLTNGTAVAWGKIPQSMIRPAFAISSFASNYTSVELGQTLTDVQFSLHYTDTVMAAVITQGTNTLALSSPFTSYVDSNSYTMASQGSILFTAHVTAYDNTVYTSNTQISWLPKKFYGVLPLQTDLTSTISLLQNSALASSRLGTWVVTAGASDYIYFAIPSSFDSSLIQFTVGGFSGGFSKVGTDISYINAYGATLNYNIYKSDNLNLGQTIVTVS